MLMFIALFVPEMLKARVMGHDVEPEPTEVVEQCSLQVGEEPEA